MSTDGGPQSQLRVHITDLHHRREIEHSKQSRVSLGCQVRTFPAEAAFPVSYSGSAYSSPASFLSISENLCRRPPAVIDSRMTGNKLRGRRWIFMSRNKSSPFLRTSLLRASSSLRLVNGTGRRLAGSGNKRLLNIKAETATDISSRRAPHSLIINSEPAYRAPLNTSITNLRWKRDPWILYKSLLYGGNCYGYYVRIS